MQFADRLLGEVKRVGNPIMLGIDPRVEDLPKDVVRRFSGDLRGKAQAIGAFGREVIDAVRGLVPVVKFQAAFYEEYGPEGLVALENNAEYARRHGLIVVLDGKRNDIGSTAEAYARAYLGRVGVGEESRECWPVDALTVNPYLGSDGITPFVEAAAREDKGLFVLVRTSNPSAGEFQDLIADGRPVYRHVAEHLGRWAAGHRGDSGYSLVGAVVGATYPEQLAELREALPGVLFLVPGYGAQGGSAADVAAAFDRDGLGAVVNSSRGLTFAYKRREFAGHGQDWQRSIREAVEAMADDLAANTAAGRLRDRNAP